MLVIYRKTIRLMKTELEGVQYEHSNVQKQIQSKDETIQHLTTLIGEGK